MRAVLRSAAVLFALLLGLAACGGSGPSTGGAGSTTGGPAGTAPVTATTGAPPGSAPVTATAVDIRNFTFTPQTITVKVGTTVTWTNQDRAPHTVTARDRSFDSGNLAQGRTFQHTFDKPGSYDYFCTIHPYMTGTVVVQ